ncbi:unnamed protein product [Clavelina lepadiformis]|uniref:VWFA domain-containing protein n=1 Tax=Clavelina lepadiformis TaxID=159417 RepID=A0ABP0H2D5_CLALP
MKMKIAVATLGLFMLLQSTTFGKKHMKTKRLLSTNRRNVMADALLEVEPLPPDVVMSECTCRCCEQTPAPLTSPLCANDVVMAVDSSACFRDYYSRMMRFLRKLVRRIGRTPNIQYGGDETRLSLMQFSSDIVFPLELSSFEHYTNPSTKKGILEGINDQLDNLQFLGEGSFLNKALNATVSHIQSQPRPQNLLDQISPVVPRKVVIIMTNGKSHPSVTMNNIETSIAAMENEGITVIPVSVTRECHGFQSDQWNEGLCPDTVVLGKLAKVGRDESSSFMEMTSQDTIPDILNILECHPQASSLTAAPCNNCTCSCELPVGPRGPEGPRGVKGDFVQGKPGIDGETGSKGEVGEKGDRGPVGEKGSVGEKGIFGDKGEPGNVGEKGDTGDIGPMGKVGQKGEVGDIGPKGAIGKIGPEGPKGDEGEKGEVGEQGKVGNKGEEGEKGTKGDSGNKGSKGVGEKGRKGQPGPVGPEGPDGRKGDRGPKGDEGKRGLCGKPGPAGKRGIEGVPGVDGIDGPAGPQGTQGPRGQVGLHGDKGGPGEPGTNGEEGPRGFPGERGRPGPQGADGLKGEKGEPSREIGPQGFSGPSGQKGEPGVEGADGLDGREGPSGRQGPTGPPGPPGPPAVYNLEELRPIIVDIIRELLPGECGKISTYLFTFEKEYYVGFCMLYLICITLTIT